MSRLYNTGCASIGCEPTSQGETSYSPSCNHDVIVFNVFLQHSTLLLVSRYRGHGRMATRAKTGQPGSLPFAGSFLAAHISSGWIAARNSDPSAVRSTQLLEAFLDSCLA